MKDLVAANRYAGALFEAAQLLHNDMEMRAELDAFALSLKSSAETERFLNNPYFKIGDKRRFLQKIYQKRTEYLHDTLINFLTILLEKGRFALIHEIVDSFKRIVDEKHGMGTAEIRSAAPLSDEAEREIIALLEKIAGYRVTVKATVDPALIGGVAVKIQNKVLDGTVRHKLDLFKKELTKIGSI